MGMKLCGACKSLSDDLLIEVRNAINETLETRSQIYMATSDMQNEDNQCCCSDKNNLQQLKDKIAALVTKCCTAYYFGDAKEFDSCIEAMRKLSY